MSAHTWKVSRLRRARRRLSRPCGRWSPGVVGYQCDLRFRHKGQHAATTSVTTNGFGREIGRSVRRWGTPEGTEG